MPLQAGRSLRLGATLLLLLLLGATVGPRARILRDVRARADVVAARVPIHPERPAIHEVTRKRPRLTVRSVSALEALRRSAAAESAALEPVEPIEKAVEPLRSATTLALSNLRRGDLLEVARPLLLPAARPRPLVPLYVSFATLQAADAITTMRALENPRLREVNPVVRPLGRNAAGMIVLKSASTAATVLAVEQLWRKNRVAAVATMAGINAAYAAIVARNVRATH